MSPVHLVKKAVINQFIQGITPVALKANLILAHKGEDCFRELTQVLKRARLEEERLTLLDEAQEETEQLNAMRYKGAQLPHPHVSRHLPVLPSSQATFESGKPRLPM